MKAARQLIKKWLLRHGAVISRPPGQFQVGHYKMLQLKKRGFTPEVAVDGGAASGGWTREIKALFPEVQVLCIEPRDDAQPQLKQLRSELPGIQIAHTLVGEEAGSVIFSVHGAQSSTLHTHRGETFGQTVQCPVNTLDRLIAQHGLPWPDLIKLDLQGAELRCLRGAEHCVANAQMIQLEVSFIPLMQDMPLVADVLSFMAERGYRCYDIFGLWHRPLDGALAQGDVVFIREGNPLLAETRWSRDATWT